jgi:hypothetical protein
MQLKGRSMKAPCAHEAAQPQIGLDERGRIADRGHSVEPILGDQVHRLKPVCARGGAHVLRREMAVMQQRQSGPAMRAGSVP